MSRETFDGWVVRRDWNALEIHHFNAESHSRISVTTFRPYKGQPMQLREIVLREIAAEAGLTIPIDFNPNKKP